MTYGAIIVINSDLSDNVKAVAIRQLGIDETINGAEYDARLAIDPSYPNQIHLRKLRLMVVRPLTIPYNMAAVDYVVFVKNGLAYIENVKVGPPGTAYPLDRITFNKIKFAGYNPIPIPNPFALTPLMPTGTFKPFSS